MVNTYINIINLKDNRNNNKNTVKFLLKLGIKLYVYSTLMKTEISLWITSFLKL